jgi:hypothetical protein
MEIWARLQESKSFRAARIAAPLLALAIVINLCLPNEQAASLSGYNGYLMQTENRLPESASSAQSQDKIKENSKEIAAARQRQIASDSAKLLQMAVDLKAEMDKSTKDTLSLNIVRKADAITKLAHDLKEEMKQSSGED